MDVAMKRGEVDALKITTKHLKGACADQVTLFKKTFPNGAPLTKKAMSRAMDVGLDVWWLERFLSELARAEYERATAPARAEYELVRAPALAEYYRVTASALAEYELVRASAWAEYGRVAASALLIGLQQSLGAE